MFSCIVSMPLQLGPFLALCQGSGGDQIELAPSLFRHLDCYKRTNYLWDYVSFSGSLKSLPFCVSVFLDDLLLVRKVQR